MERFGLTSMVFFDTTYLVMELPRKAYAFMMLSVFIDQPSSELLSTHRVRQTRAYHTRQLRQLSLHLLQRLLHILIGDLRALLRGRLRFLSIKLVQLLHPLLLNSTISFRRKASTKGVEDCCKVSWETFGGRSLESTTPF